MAMPQAAQPAAATLEFKVSVYADGSIGVSSTDGEQKFGTIEEALKAVLQMYADEAGAGEEQEAYEQAAGGPAAKAVAGAAKPAMMY